MSLNRSGNGVGFSGYGSSAASKVVHHQLVVQR
jgi:hypothetical protein